MTTQTPTKKTPETLSELFPNPWLAASELPRPVHVTIATAEIVQVYSDRERGKVSKLALGMTVGEAGHIHATSKRLLCNVTQARALAALAKSEKFADWLGLKVTLTPTTADNGKATIAITAAPHTTPAPGAEG